MNFKTTFLNTKKFPLVVESGAKNAEKDSEFESLIALCVEKRKFFQDELVRYGALLFRGFSVRDESLFERFVRAFSGKNLLDYAGGVSPRVELTNGGVYTSTEYPPHLMLSLHNELSYSNNYPSEVYFCCITAPEKGGETPIGDSRRILKNIDAEIVEEFRRKKIKYERNLQGDISGSGYSWQDAFETTDKSFVEDCCRKIGANFQWRENGSLRLSQIRPATIIHPQTGEEVWFNQAEGFHPSNLDEETRALFPDGEYRLNAGFADGTPFDVEQLEHVRKIMHKEMTVFPWETGDVLVLDNLLAAHGRMPFTGKRKIILAMT